LPEAIQLFGHKHSKIPDTAYTTSSARLRGQTSNLALSNHGPDPGLALDFALPGRSGRRNAIVREYLCTNSAKVPAVVSTYLQYITVPTRHVGVIILNHHQEPNVRSASYPARSRPADHGGERPGGTASYLRLCRYVRHTYRVSRRAALYHTEGVSD
jgi:hypothetical protein